MRKLVSGKFMVMLSVVLMIAGFTVSSAFAAKSPDTTTIVVKIVPGLTGGQQVAVVARNGGVKTSSIPSLRLLIIAVPKIDLPRILPSYQADPWVERVEVAQSRKAEAAPSDAHYGVQWNLPKISWDSVYGAVTPTGTATVALLDTGIEASHPDLAGVIVPGTSILDNSNGLTDLNGHGTYLAGIIAAVTDNGSGIAGIAYQGVKIIPVSVLGADGTGEDSDIIAGIVWAADHGAHVILMGFSNPNFSQNLQDAIDYAWSKGAVLVAATGNDGMSTPAFPAGARGVIGVSATDETDLLVAGSNYGLDTFLAAPGANIYTTSLAGSYTYITGTSASSAIVAGVAGFMKAIDPTLGNGVIVGRLAKSADAIGTAGDPNNQLFFGNGRVNMAKALAETSTDEVQPAGESGGGGPIVGPYTAAVGSVTVATGGSALSADTAGVGGTGAFTPLTGPVITETNNAGMSTGTMVLFAPAGYEFDTTPNSVTVTTTLTARVNTVSGTAGQALSKTVTPTASSMTIYVSTASTGSGRATFTWSGIKVRPINSTPLAASGNIYYSGTSTGVNLNTNMGTLTEVAGAANAAHSTVSPGTATKTADGTSTQVITVQARDANNNNLTTGGASVVFSTTAGSMSATTDVGNGTYTATWTAPTLVGTGSATVTATLGGTAIGTSVGASSSVITLQAGVATQVGVETAANGSGSVLTAQNVAAGSTVVCYAVTRDSHGNFIANVAADVWALPTKTGGIVNGDLVAAGDNKSATFTGHLIGTATIRATSGALTTTDSGLLTVTAGTLHHFGLATVSSPQTANASFGITLTAQDVLNNTVTAFAGTTDFSVSGGSTISPAITGNFTGGVWTGSVTVSGGGNGRIITATRTGGTETGTSNSFNVDKATPNVTAWPTAGTITYGQTLAAATLSGGTATPVGSFAFTTPATSPNAGTAAQGVTYTPTDSTNYTTATSTVSVTVNKANPNVTAWPTAGTITYGQALSAATLTGGASSVAGSFAYDAPATVPGAGSYSAAVTFTPTDANYNLVSGTVSVAVAKATPTATLSVSNSPQTYTGSGQAASVNISASSVAGTVANVLTGGAASQTNAATYAVTADFVPTDSSNYTSLTGLSAGNFVISKATPTATLSVSNSPQAYTGSGQAASVNISASSVAGTVANVLTGGAASQTNAATYAVTADFVPADSNYTSLTGLSAGNFVISKATPTATISVSNSPQAYTGSGQAASVNISASSVAGTVANVLTGGAASQTNAATYVVTANFVPADGSNYATLTGLSAGNFVISKATPTATLSVSNSPQAYTGSGQAASVNILASSVAGTVANVLTGGAASQTNAATYTVTADFVPTDSSNYTGLTGLSAGNFVINPANQTINFGPLADKNLGDTVTLSASATSTLAVSFASQTTGICTTGGAYGTDVTLVAIGTCTVRATQAGSANFFAAPPVDQSFNVNPGVLDHFAFSVISSPRTAGSPFGVTITAQDAGNNTVTAFTGTVNLTSTAGTITPTSTTVFVNGTWIGSVSVTGAGVGKAIIATDPVSGKTGTSGSFDVSPAAAAGFSVSAPPSASAGSAISVTVTAKDAYNNVATGYLGTIHFTGTDSHSGMALPADFTFQPGDNGSHTFNGEVTLETAGPQTVTATDTTVPAIFGISNSIAVSPAGAAKLLVTAPPTTTAGTAIDVTVTVKDTYDNTITDYAGSVHFTSSDPNGTVALPADYTFVAGDNGTHAFTAQTLLKTSGTQTVTATDTVTSLINGTSGSINVGYAAASKLMFGQQPVTTTPVQAITPAVTVRVEDQYGNLVVNSTAPVAMAIGTNPGSGVLSGTTPQNSVNGIATFNDLSIDVAASGYQLTATSSSLASATSSAFDIAAGALHHFVISSIGTQAALSGFSLTITAQDGSNNTVTSFTGTADLSVSGGSTISPATTGNFSNGIWTGYVTVSGGGTGRVITATRTGGSESGASNSFDVNKTTATVSLSNMTQTYTGSPLTPGVSTTPSGLTVDLTGAPQTNAGSYPVTATINDSNYQGNSSGTLTISKAIPVVTSWPTAGTITYGQTLGSSTLSGGSGTPAGSFSWTNPASAPHAGTTTQNVTFTPGDTDNFSTVTGTVTITVNKATAPVTLSNLTTTYEGIPFTGIPQVPTATTIPAGLRIVWTNAPQSNAGSYAVTATIDDTDYQGSASGTFTINKAAARVTLANLSVTYDRTPKAVSANTDPFGLTVNVTYNGTGTVPTEPGNYAVSATINDANYQGNTSGTLVIAKAAATVSLSNMTQNYTGSPLTPTAATNPPGLGITWTNAPQTSTGSYAVTATINDVHYQGSAGGTFTINSSALPACGAPTSITAPGSNTTGSLTVSWSPSNISGVTYVLESSKDGGAYTTVYSGLSTAATISIAANGSYTFRVKAIKTDYADSTYTTSGSCVVMLTSGAPASITVPASNTTGSITVSWSLSNISGATYVLESSKDGGAYAVVYSGLSTAATITVAADGSYSFRVKAVKAGYADSAYTTSGTCLETLASGAPASITVPASNTTGSITVSWSASNISGATYVLESSKDGGAYTAVYSGLSTAATITVTADGNYTFRVKATKAGYADSAYKTSGICLVTLTCGTPATITVPASNTTGSFSVTWGSSNISGVTYVLERSTDGVTWTTANSGLSTAATITVAANGSYTFRVKATKAGYADSAYKTSGICLVTLTCGTPATITVPASNTTGSFSVVWGSSNISGVTYVLERSTDGVTWTTAYSGLSTAATVIVPGAGSYSFRVKATKAGYADSSYRISSGSCLVTM